MVEDAPVNLEVGTGMLEALGCRVDSACNGLQALDAIASKSYDLVLMDCQMPLMDGYQATRRVRELERQQAACAGSPPKRLTVIALTAHAMPNDRQVCLEAGMDDYLAKPFTKAGMGALLSRWLPAAAPEGLSPEASGRAAAPPAEQCGTPAPAPAPPAKPAARGLDTERIDEIRALQRPGKADLLARVIDQYLSDGVSLIAAMRCGFDSGDPAAVQGACHRFKSSSAFLGADWVADLCGELEGICRAGRLPEDAGYLANIEEGYREARRSLELLCRPT